MTAEPAIAKPRTADAFQRAEPPFQVDDPEAKRKLDSAFFDIPASEAIPPAPLRPTPSAKALKAQARERREHLLALLDRIAEGGQPSRKDSLDAILAVIEDAHSSDPVLFGVDAAGHFARLHEARSSLIF